MDNLDLAVYLANAVCLPILSLQNDFQDRIDSTKIVKIINGASLTFPDIYNDEILDKFSQLKFSVELVQALEKTSKLKTNQHILNALLLNISPDSFELVEAVLNIFEIYFNASTDKSSIAHKYEIVELMTQSLLHANSRLITLRQKLCHMIELFLTKSEDCLYEQITQLLEIEKDLLKMASSQSNETNKTDLLEKIKKYSSMEGAKLTLSCFEFVTDQIHRPENQLAALEIIGKYRVRIIKVWISWLYGTLIR